LYWCKGCGRHMIKPGHQRSHSSFIQVECDWACGGHQGACLRCVLRASHWAQLCSAGRGQPERTAHSHLQATHILCAGHRSHQIGGETLFWWPAVTHCEQVRLAGHFTDHGEGVAVWRVSWNVTGTILASSGDDGKVRIVFSPLGQC